MKRLASLALLVAGVASSHAVLLDSTVLQTVPGGSTSHYYAGYGMTLNAAIGVQPIAGFWPGVWIGSQDYQGSNAIEFVFDSAVTKVEFYFSAMSEAIGSYDEGFSDITTNGAGTSLALSLASGTTLTGDDIDTSINDGRGLVTVTASGTFTKVMFNHWNTGASAGTVIESISYDPVPEPATMAVLGLGLAAIAKRRRR